MIKRKLLAAALAALLASVQLLAAIPASDNFTGTDGQPISNGNWTQATTPALIFQSNKAAPDNTNVLACAYWKTATDDFGDDQESSAVVSGMSAGATIAGVYVRGAGTSDATWDGYVAWSDSTTGLSWIERVNDGTRTTLTGSDNWSSAPANGDTLKLRVTGTGATVTLKVFVNGGEVESVDDTHANRVLTGQPGICGFNSPARIDDWVGDNYSAPAGGTGKSGLLLGVG